MIILSILWTICIFFFSFMKNIFVHKYFLPIQESITKRVIVLEISFVFEKYLFFSSSILYYTKYCEYLVNNVKYIRERFLRLWHVYGVRDEIYSCNNNVTRYPFSEFRTARISFATENFVFFEREREREIMSFFRR